jgi:archaeal flagellin FlaB
MNSIKQRDEGFTGLEAAIVLIAFVVVAAVFSYVVLGAGFFTTQKSQQTVYKSVEQATTNLQMIGNVYGTAQVPGTGIDNISFNVGLAPGAPSMDLSKMIIVVSQPTVGGLTQLPYGTTLSATVFTVTNASGATLSNGVLNPLGQATITFELADPLRENGQVMIELRPGVGAALPFTRTAPAQITASQILV